MYNTTNRIYVHLRIDKDFHILKPLAVFTLFFPLCQLGNEEGEIGSDTALFEVCVKLFLNFFVERFKLRTYVETTSLPVGFHSQFRGELGVRVERNGFHEELSVLRLGIDVEGSLVWLREKWRGQ